MILTPLLEESYKINYGSIPNYEEFRSIIETLNPDSTDENVPDRDFDQKLITKCNHYMFKLK